MPSDNKWVHTIDKEDVGKTTVGVRCHCCGHRQSLWIGGAIGLIQKGDVGKRVYVNRQGTVSVENDEQRDKRTAGYPNGRQRSIGGKD